MAELKKKELIAALAEFDAVAEEVVRLRTEEDPRDPIAHALDRVRFWPQPVREAVNLHRKEHGDATDESLTHESARRLNNALGSGERWDASWEVKGWREVERLETHERVFEVTLLGIDLPVEGEELIPIVRRRTDEPDVDEVLAEPWVHEKAREPSPSDFCECAHTRGSHNHEDKTLGGQYTDCELCDCKEFRLLGPGMTKLKIEETPPDPHPMLTIPDTEDEGAAITFLRQLVGEAGLDEPDPESWMALQRLLAKGWRIVPPREED